MDKVIPGPVVKKEVQYIPSFGHLRYDLLQNIVDNPEYKKLAIDILRQFDNSIADICYTKADDGTYLESIITKDGVNMPFSVYGDGIKKILYILNKLFNAADAVDAKRAWFEAAIEDGVEIKAPTSYKKGFSQSR